LTTAAVNALSAEVQAAAINPIKTFSPFTEDDDPNQAHDFGSFEVAAKTSLRKIDHYDETCTYGSGDPYDLDITTAR
jgi:hypothetical protein